MVTGVVVKESPNSMFILVIEDNQMDFCLIERALGDQFALRHESTLAAGLERANREVFDLVILDLTLDDSRGYETFEKALAALRRTPILVLSGTDDEDLALRAVCNGAQEYIPKSRLLDYPLDRAARYAIERRRAEDAARRNELRYRALFDNLPTPAFTCDADGLITYYNQKAIEIWGRAPKLNDPADRYSGAVKLFAADGTLIPHRQSWMARALIERKGFNGREIIIQRPSGECRNALAHVNPFFDENGVLGGAIAVLIDITSQRQSEKEFRESERFARSVVNSLSSHIAILDQNGTILSVNSAWQRFASVNGLKASDFGVGANYLRICENAGCGSDEFASQAAAGIRDVLKGERKTFYHEYPCNSPTEERWFAMQVSPFEGDGPTRVVVSHDDITARKLAERLAGERLGLQQAVAGMEQVLGVVGHELRTPLAAIRAISEFLTTDGARNTAEADRFVMSISEEVDRMSDTVNNLLEAARLNSGRARWNWSDVDLQVVIEEAICSVVPLIDSTRVHVDFKLENAIKSIRGDADALRRILINLLSNARKHTSDGRIEVRCRQYTSSGVLWVDLTVRDTGSGIPPEVLARLGDAFALNSGVVGNNYIRGTGLGLAICKGIAKAHGGELLIQSVLGEGTSVTVRFVGDLESAATGDTQELNPYQEMAA